MRAAAPPLALSTVIQRDRSADALHEFLAVHVGSVEGTLPRRKRHEQKGLQDTVS